MTNLELTGRAGSLVSSRCGTPGSGGRHADDARISISAVVAGGSGGSPYVAA